jgi:hypothetical protein
MRAAPCFFCACVGMSLANNISARFFFAPRSWWSCSATASGSPEARAGDTGAHPTPALDFFRAISAGECLLVSTVALCGAKLNSLTPLGSVVLPLLKITTERTSLAALCNEILCSKCLHGSSVTKRTNIRCERPFATFSQLRLPAWCCYVLYGLFSRRRHTDSHVALCRDERGRFFFSNGPHSSHKAQSTRPHMQKRRRPLRTAVDACARAV